MRFIFFILLIFFTGYTARAQKITLLPQVGVQFIKSKLEYATLASINNRYLHLNPYVGFRLMYQTKKGCGPFAGIANGNIGYSYELFLPATIDMNVYDLHRSSSMVDVWRFELGYHWNTKPIYFKKIWDNHVSREDFANLKQKGLSVRIQPLIGLAYQKINEIGPGGATSGLNGAYITEEDIPTGKSGNFAIVAGLGFEFGRNDKRKFTLSFNYVRGIGLSAYRTKLTIDTPSANYKGLLGSNGTGFNITLGIPLTLWSKKR